MQLSMLVVAGSLWSLPGVVEYGGTCSFASVLVAQLSIHSTIYNHQPACACANKSPPTPPPPPSHLHTHLDHGCTPNSHVRGLQRMPSAPQLR